MAGVVSDHFTEKIIQSLAQEFFWFKCALQPWLLLDPRWCKWPKASFPLCESAAFYLRSGPCYSRCKSRGANPFKWGRCATALRAHWLIHACFTVSQTPCQRKPFVKMQHPRTWWRGYDKDVQRWRDKHQQAVRTSAECTGESGKLLSEAAPPTSSY